jgi:hypothetical protein
MMQVSQLVQIKQGWSICFVVVFLIFSFVVSSVRAQPQPQPQANTTTQQSASVQQQLDLINQKLNYLNSAIQAISARLLAQAQGQAAQGQAAQGQAAQGQAAQGQSKGVKWTPRARQT